MHTSPVNPGDRVLNVKMGRFLRPRCCKTLCAPMATYDEAKVLDEKGNDDLLEFLALYDIIKDRLSSCLQAVIPCHKSSCSCSN